MCSFDMWGYLWFKTTFPLGDEVSEARGRVHQKSIPPHVEHPKEEQYKGGDLCVTPLFNQFTMAQSLIDYYRTYANCSLFIFFDECPIFVFYGLFLSSINSGTLRSLLRFGFRRSSTTIRKKYPKKNKSRTSLFEPKSKHFA